MYAELGIDDAQLSNSLSNSIDGIDKDNPRISDGSSSMASSMAFFLILLTVVTLCLSFIKKSVSFLTGKKKVKRAVQCTRISVISESGSVVFEEAKMSRLLQINEFRGHFKDLALDSYYKLSLEFDSLKTRGEELLPCTEGERGVNRPKNRFVNVLPFNHSRFILTPVEGIAGSDYINANYVSGYYSNNNRNESREYIATQGPLQNTANDFWRMCWESGSKCIVMLTRFVDKGSSTVPTHYMYNNILNRGNDYTDREKCFRYWPCSSLPEMYGDIEVGILSERLEGYRCIHRWIITEFKIRYKGNEREVRHYQFLSWPDFESVEPPEALVHFVREVRKFAAYPTLGKPVVPIIIHCSAGIGRTGTFIGVDIAMNQLKMKKGVNIPSIVSKMRKERVWMVQTEQQYTCMYKCAIAILDDIDAHQHEGGGGGNNNASGDQRPSMDIPVVDSFDSAR